MKTILVDAVNCFVLEQGNIFEPMHALLESYPNTKIIVTGADDDQMKIFNLDKMPYEVFTLKHNPEKSDPAYFEKMLAYYGLHSRDVVYIEHTREAAESAKSIGITSYDYDSDKQNLEALKQFLNRHL